jgi:hypothetical protein
VSAPILFPWEIINVNGLVEERAFGSQYHNNSVYPLFSGIWERARREIRSADRISFVGLSMHQFLEGGLKYLFDGRKGTVEVVMANPLNAPFIGAKGGDNWSRNPHSPAYVLNQVLGKVAPHMTRLRGDIKLINDFGEFVKTQMTPFEIG